MNKISTESNTIITEMGRLEDNIAALTDKLTSLRGTLSYVCRNIPPQESPKGTEPSKIVSPLAENLIKRNKEIVNAIEMIRDIQDAIEI